MLKKRIIPCLDIKEGRTVKGVNFLELKDAGDPVELAHKYAQSGADELVFLDITATIENRNVLVNLVGKIAAVINIPFTVGGGIKCVEDAAALISAGADKVSINSAAVKNPSLISDLSARFGNQCVVVAVDAKFFDGEWWVVINGGRVKTNFKVKEWCQKAEVLGCGEILLTSMDNDGTKEGYNIELMNEVCAAVNVPVIASGGAGSATHFLELFLNTKASGALAASIFHFNETSIPNLKNNLQQQNILVRWN